MPKPIIMLIDTESERRRHATTAVNQIFGQDYDVRIFDNFDHALIKYEDIISRKGPLKPTISGIFMSDTTEYGRMDAERFLHTIQSSQTATSMKGLSVADFVPTIVFGYDDATKKDVLRWKANAFRAPGNYVIPGSMHEKEDMPTTQTDDEFFRLMFSEIKNKIEAAQSPQR